MIGDKGFSRQRHRNFETYMRKIKCAQYWPQPANFVTFLQQEKPATIPEDEENKENEEGSDLSDDEKDAPESSTGEESDAAHESCEEENAKEEPVSAEVTEPPISIPKNEEECKPDLFPDTEIQLEEDGGVDAFPDTQIDLQHVAGSK